MGALAASPVVAQDSVDAEPVIAAFVYRFTQFVEWPPAALQDLDQFGICVAASDDFVQTVQSLVSDSEIGGRPLVARAVDANGLEGCQVLFVAGGADRAETFVEAANGQPILTVSDSTGFLDAGGMIELRIVDRRIRFGVDAASAGRAGLRFSSQLLDLALEVRGGPA